MTKLAQKINRNIGKANVSVSRIRINEETSFPENIEDCKKHMKKTV